MFAKLWEFENSDACSKVKMQLIEQGNVSEDSYEEAKREHFGDVFKGEMSSCIHLWGMAKLRRNNMLQDEGTLGYKYEVNVDNDESEEEIDEDSAE